MHRKSAWPNNSKNVFEVNATKSVCSTLLGSYIIKIFPSVFGRVRMRRKGRYEGECGRDIKVYDISFVFIGHVKLVINHDFGTWYDNHFAPLHCCWMECKQVSNFISTLHTIIHIIGMEKDLKELQVNYYLLLFCGCVISDIL